MARSWQRRVRGCAASSRRTGSACQREWHGGIEQLSSERVVAAPRRAPARRYISFSSRHLRVLSAQRTRWFVWIDPPPAEIAPVTTAAERRRALPGDGGRQRLEHPVV